MAKFRFDLAGRIKGCLDMDKVAGRYGFEPSRAGFIRCPFHTGDRTASLKIYPDTGGWHCFGCGKGGSVIDFTMELFDLSFFQACIRLNSDFGLGLTQDEPDHKALLAERKRAQEAARKQAIENVEEQFYLEEHRYWWEAMLVFMPEADGYVHPLYAESVKRLPYLDYLLENCADRRWGTSASRALGPGGHTQKRTS